MNASGRKSAAGEVNENASVSIPEWTVIGSANENGSESEGNENGRSVYGGGGTHAHARDRVRILVLSSRYRSDGNRGRASDGYRDGNLGVSACRLRHARPSFPSENGEIDWAIRVGS
jgi:hypothetical protein